MASVQGRGRYEIRVILAHRPFPFPLLPLDCPQQRKSTIFSVLSALPSSSFSSLPSQPGGIAASSSLNCIRLGYQSSSCLPLVQR